METKSRMGPLEMHMSLPSWLSPAPKAHTGLDQLSNGKLKRTLQIFPWIRTRWPRGNRAAGYDSPIAAYDRVNDMVLARRKKRHRTLTTETPGNTSLSDIVLPCAASKQEAFEEMCCCLYFTLLLWFSGHWNVAFMNSCRWSVPYATAYVRMSISDKTG